MISKPKIFILACLSWCISRLVYLGRYPINTTTIQWDEPTIPTTSAERRPDTTSFRLSSRDSRFPSVEQRVKLYMSNWYHPPCEPTGNYEWTSNNNSLHIRSQETDLSFTRDPGMSQIFAFEPSIVKTIAYRSNRDVLSSYCKDLTDIQEREKPLLFSFGDGKATSAEKDTLVPHFRKVRYAATVYDIEHAAPSTKTCLRNSERNPLRTNSPVQAMQPVIWKLNSKRHYGLIEEVDANDVPWGDKKNAAIFRGCLSGGRGDGYNRESSDYENCMTMRRCRLVYESDQSSLIDAKITNLLGFVNETIRDVQLLSERVTLEEQLRYKALIMLEGNDVSSGLKWALYSNSVVLMPPPTMTSYAMEELLEPYVHYVPLDPSLDNVEEQMQWIIEHDEEAQKIAQRGKLWIEDLFFHPQAEAEDREIRKEILKRYSSHFEPFDVEGRKSDKPKKVEMSKPLEPFYSERTIKINNIRLVGERHCGSTWITEHLQECFNYTDITISSTFNRHKHWFQRHEPQYDSVLVATFRNPYDWVTAMYDKHAYHAPHHLNFGWKDFVTTPWTLPNYTAPQNVTRCWQDFLPDEIVPCLEAERPTEVLKESSNMIFEIRAAYELQNNGSGKPYKSIVDLRADKIRHFLGLKSLVHSFYPVQYEYNVLHGTAPLIENLEQALGVSATCVPSPPQEMHYRSYPKEFIEWMKENVDWQAESMVGYSSEMIGGTIL